jgi:hypothetical protein
VKDFRAVHYLVLVLLPHQEFALPLYCYEMKAKKNKAPMDDTGSFSYQVQLEILLLVNKPLELPNISTCAVRLHFLIQYK